MYKVTEVTDKLHVETFEEETGNGYITRVLYYYGKEASYPVHSKIFSTEKASVEEHNKLIAKLTKNSLLQLIENTQEYDLEQIRKGEN